MSILLVDCETFSELDVTEVGSRIYAQHPSTRVTLWSVRDPDWADSLVFEEPDLYKVLGELKKARQIKWTRNEPLDLIHWSPFDRHILNYTYGVELDPEANPGAYTGPNNTFVCDLQTLSLVYGGPAQLEYAARFFGGVEQAKHKDGKRLIKMFCAPQADGSIIKPEDEPIHWQKFVAYARQDTNVMVPVLNAMMEIEEGESLAEHWAEYRAVERMNERGAPIDLESAKRAFRDIHDSKDAVLVDMKREYGLNVNAPNQVKEFLGTEDCKRDTLEELLETNTLTDEQIDVCEARLLVSGAATAKLKPMVARGSATDPPRVYDAFRWFGAWTGRLTSTSPQLHNFVRSAVDESYFEALHAGVLENVFRETRANIRGFIQAADDDVLVASDYNAIECRVAAWIAGEQWLLDAFEQGADPYLTMATAIYGTEVTDKEDPRRQFGKTVELGSQYQLGWKGLIKQCAQRGIELTEEDARYAIDTYRDLHPAIVETWRSFDDTFAYLVHTKDTIEDHGITFTRTNKAIKSTRPSGKTMWYWMPRLKKDRWPDKLDDEDNIIEEGKEKMSLAFTGRYHDVMTTQTTYGGNIFQGAVQGAAADLMLHGMLGLEAEGFKPIMSIHDEVVCEHSRDEFEASADEDIVNYMGEVLCDLPEWAEGLPVAAEGWMQRRFTK